MIVLDSLIIELYALRACPIHPLLTQRFGTIYLLELAYFHNSSVPPFLV